jgi:deltex
MLSGLSGSWRDEIPKKTNKKPMTTPPPPRSVMLKTMEYILRYVKQYGRMTLFPMESHRMELVNDSLQAGTDLFTTVSWWEATSNGEEVERCPICLCDYERGEDIVHPQVCVHQFHRTCLYTWSTVKPQCPICREPFVIHTGPQPRHVGEYCHVQKQPFSLLFYPSCSALSLRIFIPAGRDPRTHIPHTGVHVTVFLPDNVEGQDLIRLLELGFKRRLLFRPQGSTLVPNGIELKRFPDVTYLARLRGDLRDAHVV